jgi:hypothetical protein
MNDIIYTHHSPYIHSIVITTDVKFKERLLATKIEADNIMFIDDQIKLINENTNNSILNYNYEIINETQIKVAILFKHILKSLNIGQKYIKCTISINVSENTIYINNDPNLDIKIPISNGVEFIPLSDINISIAHHETDTSKIVVTMNFETKFDTTNDKSFDVLLTMFKEFIIQGIEDANK